MTPEELRLECLKLVQHSASASGLLPEPSQIIARARAYADFVMDYRGQGGAGSASDEQNPERMTQEGFRKHQLPIVAPLQSHAHDGSASAEERTGAV